MKSTQEARKQQVFLYHAMTDLTVGPVYELIFFNQETQVHLRRTDAFACYICAHSLRKVNSRVLNVIFIFPKDECSIFLDSVIFA